MADWRDQAEISGDVVFFSLNSEDIEKQYEEVFVSDLDKTYLDTSWGSPRELWRTIIEKAFQKRNVPGTGSLFQALKQTWQDERGRRAFPIYFITASPPQMEEKIREKLELDDILPLGMFYKDNLQNLKPGRLWRLTAQIGYKVQALLQLRTHLKEDVRQVLWGDDSESDAVIYSLYSDICARRLAGRELQDVLHRLHVVGEQTETILDLQERIPQQDPVEKIYINLATDTDPEYYLKFGRRTVPTYNTFQAAVDLFQDGRLKEDQVIKVAIDMLMNYDFSPEELQSSFDNIVRRQLIAKETVDVLAPLLIQNEIFAPDFVPSLEPKPIAERQGRRVFALEGVHEPWIPQHVDYLREVR